MENQYLNGVEGGMPKTKLQAMFMAFVSSAKAAVILSADIARMIKENTFKFYRKTYFVANQVTGGVGVSSDLLINMQSSEKIGLTNLNNKKIEDSRAFLVDRLELRYAYSTTTGDVFNVIPDLGWKPITDAPESLLNGEIEFFVKDVQIGRFLIADFCEPVEGTQNAKPYGLMLRAAQLIQSNEIIGFKIHTAGALDATNSLRHYIYVGVCGEGVRLK